MLTAAGQLHHLLSSRQKDRSPVLLMLLCGVIGGIREEASHDLAGDTFNREPHPVTLAL